MIAIVDYGVGNVKAFANTFERLNIAAMIAKTPGDLAAADRIVLPGVGAFDWAMEQLNRAGMRSRLDDLVLGNSRPVLGVCVGMQMMANSSEEGHLPGLGWIDAVVKRFHHDSFGEDTNLPHMGWNDVQPTSGEGLFQGVHLPRYYFLHSYYVVPRHAEDVLATTNFGGFTFASSIQLGNRYGVQFHPEKSHEWGTSLLQAFATM